MDTVPTAMQKLAVASFPQVADPDAAPYNVKLISMPNCVRIVIRIVIALLTGMDSTILLKLELFLALFSASAEVRATPSVSLLFLRSVIAIDLPTELSLASPSPVLPRCRLQSFSLGSAPTPRSAGLKELVDP